MGRPRELRDISFRTGERSVQQRKLLAQEPEPTHRGNVGLLLVESEADAAKRCAYRSARARSLSLSASGDQDVVPVPDKPKPSSRERAVHRVQVDIREQRREDRPLRDANPRPQELRTAHSFQPLLHENSNPATRNELAQRALQVAMFQVVEASADVGAKGV